MFTPRAWLPLAAAAALTATLALGATPAGATGVSWPGYGFDAQHTGYNPGETSLGTAGATQLQPLWTAALDGDVHGSPVYASGVIVGGQPTNMVYVGTDHGMFYGLNANTGAIVWQDQLPAVNTTTWAKPCYTFRDGIYGVTGPAALNVSANTVYTAAGDNQVYALDMSSGSLLPGWPVSIGSDPLHNHVWSGVTLAGNLLYVGTAGYCDYAPYTGQVSAINVTTASVAGTFYPVAQSGPPYAGGVWGPAAVSVDPSGNVFTATGNTIHGGSQHGYYGEHVLELTSTLALQAANYPGTPGKDADFGSTPVLYQAPACPPQLAVFNKDGQLFVYDQAGVAAGPVQTLQIAKETGRYAGNMVGTVAYDPVTNMIYVANPAAPTSGLYVPGLVALAVQPDCSLALAWQQPTGSSVQSPPTVANGVIYYDNGYGNQLFAFDASSGAELDAVPLSGPGLAAPIVAAGTVFTGAGSTVEAFTPGVPVLSLPGGSTTVASQLSASVSGFAPGETVALHFGSATGLVVGSMTADSTGAGSGTLTVPPTKRGTFAVDAVGEQSGRTVSGQVAVTPALLLTPGIGSSGTTVTATVTSFKPNHLVKLTWATSNGTLLATVIADAHGSATTTFGIPQVALGSYVVHAGGKGVSETAAFLVSG